MGHPVSMLSLISTRFRFVARLHFFLRVYNKRMPVDPSTREKVNALLSEIKSFFLQAKDTPTYQIGDVARAYTQLVANHLSSVSDEKIRFLVYSACGIPLSRYIQNRFDDGPVVPTLPAWVTTNQQAMWRQFAMGDIAYSPSNVSQNADFWITLLGRSAMDILTPIDMEVIWDLMHREVASEFRMVLESNSRQLKQKVNDAAHMLLDARSQDYVWYNNALANTIPLDSDNPPMDYDATEEWHNLGIPAMDKRPIFNDLASVIGGFLGPHHSVMNRLNDFMKPVPGILSHTTGRRLAKEDLKQWAQHDRSARFWNRDDTRLAAHLREIPFFTNDELKFAFPSQGLDKAHFFDEVVRRHTGLRLSRSLLLVPHHGYPGPRNLHSIMERIMMHLIKLYEIKTNGGGLEYTGMLHGIIGAMGTAVASFILRHSNATIDQERLPKLPGIDDLWILLAAGDMERTVDRLHDPDPRHGIDIEGRWNLRAMRKVLLKTFRVWVLGHPGMGRSFRRLAAETLAKLHHSIVDIERDHVATVFGRAMAMSQKDMQQWVRSTRKRKWDESTQTFPILDFESVPPVASSSSIDAEFQTHGFDLWRVF